MSSKENPAVCEFEINKSPERGIICMYTIYIFWQNSLRNYTNIFQQNTKNGQ